MQVRCVHLKHFKKFRDQRFDLTDPETGLARPLIVLVGENGNGKSTVLQAIAATLGTATGRLPCPADLDWPGFELALVGNAWGPPSEATVGVGFSDEEVKATEEYFEKVPGLLGRPGVTPPFGASQVELTFHEGHIEAGHAGYYSQFRGREYAKQVVKLVEDGHKVFEKVGAVFWYTEHRTSTSLTPEIVSPANRDRPNSEPGVDHGEYLHFNEDLLRRRLADLMQFHERVERGYQLRPGQRDLFADLQRAYTTVFPGRRFEGAVPRSDIDEVLNEPWFFLHDGHHQYEISEMSGGERAIFPLLFDFANWQINNSVVLIDEIELHLHPPLQQALVRALPALGRNNQFIITTHSDWVAENVPPDCVRRMGDAG